MAAPPARTVRQLIEAAYRKIGVYASGEAVSADDMADGLFAFQDMLAEWSGDSLLISSIIQDEITLVVDQEEYTIGETAGADKDSIRPDQIITAFVREGTYDYPVKIIGERAFALFGDKQAGGTRPEYLWYNPTAPNGTINVYRSPGSADTLIITSLKPLTDGATLTKKLMDDLLIPRYYHNPIVYNLAIELAPENGVEPSVIVAMKADQGLSKIRSLNVSNAAQAASIDFANHYSANNDLVRYT